MKFYYFTDTSEKSLAPFFSPKILSAAFYSIVIPAVVLIIFWPWQPHLAFYVRQGRGPFVFFPVMTTALVLYAYVQLRCGRGELAKSRFSAIYLQQLPTLEQEYGFMEYALVEFLVHLLFLLLPLMPVLTLATAISGLSFMTLIQGVSIIFTTALLYRLIGFMTYLLWGREGLIGYLLARALMGIFLFVTAINLPLVNPIRLLYALNKNLPDFGMSVSLATAYWWHIGMTSGLIVLLIPINHSLVRRHRRRNKKRG